MVYGFQNRKPIFDFEHLILKLTYPVKTHSGPNRDLIKTCPELDRDPLETRLGLDRDLAKT